MFGILPRQAHDKAVPVFLQARSASCLILEILHFASFHCLPPGTTLVSPVELSVPEGAATLESRRVLRGGASGLQIIAWTLDRTVLVVDGLRTGAQHARIWDASGHFQSSESEAGGGGKLRKVFSPHSDPTKQWQTTSRIPGISSASASAASAHGIVQPPFILLS